MGTATSFQIGVTHPVADTFYGTGTENRRGKNVFIVFLQDVLTMPKRALRRNDKARKRSQVGRRGTAAQTSVRTSQRFSVL